jgi:hypothetical protein
MRMRGEALVDDFGLPGFETRENLETRLEAAGGYGRLIEEGQIGTPGTYGVAVFAGHGFQDLRDMA